MLQHILALALKELLALLRDKRSRFVLIGPPIAQLLVFGFAATFDLQNALYFQKHLQVEYKQHGIVLLFCEVWCFFQVRSDNPAR